jgi:hypothetical protein
MGFAVTLEFLEKAAIELSEKRRTTAKLPAIRASELYEKQ